MSTKAKVEELKFDGAFIQDDNRIAINGGKQKEKDGKILKTIVKKNSEVFKMSEIEKTMDELAATITASNK